MTIVAKELHETVTEIHDFNTRTYSYFGEMTFEVVILVHTWWNQAA